MVVLLYFKVKLDMFINIHKEYIFNLPQIAKV